VPFLDVHGLLSSEEQLAEQVCRTVSHKGWLAKRGENPSMAPPHATIFVYITLNGPVGHFVPSTKRRW
jgi:hypothetical protein